MKLTIKQKIGLIIIRLPIMFCHLICWAFNLEMHFNIGVRMSMHIDDITQDMIDKMDIMERLEFEAKKAKRKARGAEA